MAYERFIILLFAVPLIFADDLSSCKEICDKKFVGGAEEKEACSRGCAKRVTTDPFGFIDCHKGCAADYSNGTEPELKACRFACSLPITTRVFMSVDLTGDKPRIQVQREEGVGMEKMFGLSNGEPGNEDFFGNGPFSSILLKPSDVNSGMADGSPFGIPSQNGPADFQKMHERMNAIVNMMLKDFIKIRSEVMKTSTDLSGSDHRPVNHDSLALRGTKVDNLGENGNPIITEFETEFAPFSDRLHRNIVSLVEARSEEAARRANTVRWLLGLVAILALFVVLAAIITFFGLYRRKNYIMMTSPNCGAAAPLPAKKVPEDGWEERQPTDGVPPPAYDQLSIHSFKKEQQQQLQDH
ncbi:unnamed protein product [Caenorhabditis auriculariae]|uniref:Uncharacterized protein n=1 Tax=Caenorhabditis auriculariae TaxID=2777116 RepID=A0A8S1HUY4_9PELO|nr:unnamed protein product [Caenorhabditis auriculariae]